MARQARNSVRAVKRQHLGFPVDSPVGSRSYITNTVQRVQQDQITDVDTRPRENPLNATFRSMRNTNAAIFGTRRWESWQLDTGWTIDNGQTSIPFNTAVLGGNHGRFYVDPVLGPVWTFNPPPRFQGHFYIDAHVEFLSTSMVNMKVAALEVWRGGEGVTNAFWRQLDKMSIGTTFQSDYTGAEWLSHIVLGNSTIVPACCGQSIYLTLRTVQDMALVVAATDLYGFVDVAWLGTDVAVETLTESPDNTRVQDNP